MSKAFGRISVKIAKLREMAAKPDLGTKQSDKERERATGSL